MSVAVAIGLKIPDNAAYTALTALQRLSVPVERVERAEIYLFDEADAAELTERIKTDETIFNPNKHRLALLENAAPRPGEVWIEPLDSSACHPERSRRVAWRLWEAPDVPARREVLSAAIERLLCNPAIEKAVY